MVAPRMSESDKIIFNFISDMKEITEALAKVIGLNVRCKYSFLIFNARENEKNRFDIAMGNDKIAR